LTLENFIALPDWRRVRRRFRSWKEGPADVVEHRDLSGGRYVVRAEQPLPEVAVDFRHQPFGVPVLGQLQDFVQHQPLAVLVESLALGGAEDPAVLQDQAGVAAAVGIDAQRVLRVGDPVLVERRARMEQAQLEAVVVQARAVDIGQHPPLAAVLEEHRVGRGDAVHRHRVQLPLERKRLAAVLPHLARLRRLRAHVQLALVAEQEREGHVEVFLDAVAQQHCALVGDFENRDVAAAGLVDVVFDEAVGLAVVRTQEGVGPEMPARRRDAGAVPQRGVFPVGVDAGDAPFLADIEEPEEGLRAQPGRHLHQVGRR
jgi:sporulation protein YlmC with PRC-barrel domain